MGRQHTIYLSEASFANLLTLKNDDESMSQVIRNALAVCADNKDTFDLVAYQNKQIDAFRRKLARVEIRVCSECHTDLTDEGVLL